jgi:hypothetical protein
VLRRIIRYHVGYEGARESLCSETGIT